MIRLLLLLCLVALAVYVWRRVRPPLERSRGPYPPGGGPPKFEAMGRCARCATHVPAAQLDAAGVCGNCRAT